MPRDLRLLRDRDRPAGPEQDRNDASAGILADPSARSPSAAVHGSITTMGVHSMHDTSRTDRHGAAARPGPGARTRASGRPGACGSTRRTIHWPAPFWRPTGRPSASHRHRRDRRADPRAPPAAPHLAGGRLGVRGDHGPGRSSRRSGPSHRSRPPHRPDPGDGRPGRQRSGEGDRCPGTGRVPHPAGVLEVPHPRARTPAHEPAPDAPLRSTPSRGRPVGAPVSRTPCHATAVEPGSRRSGGCAGKGGDGTDGPRSRSSFVAPASSSPRTHRFAAQERARPLRPIDLPRPRCRTATPRPARAGGAARRVIGAAPAQPGRSATSRSGQVTLLRWAITATATITTAGTMTSHAADPRAAETAAPPT